ncbi:MAG: hypothetical protein Q4D89_07235 [Arachnia propionica]|uniref:hypothetical protein n=1 Tax=Arachnia propionica TaxID=1750 RepID=UPI0026FFF9C6|nr:hypothetical protein [Arachnia propionica]
MKIRIAAAALAMVAGLSVAAVPSAVAAEVEATPTVTTASQATPQGFFCLFRIPRLCRYIR